MVASDFIIRIRAEKCRRPSIALPVYRPCLRAFLLPVGAPGDPPPCIRQRPFRIAGDRHCWALRVRAPHRGLRCMGNLLCMGLFLRFRMITSPRVLDRADHRLATGVNVDVLDSDFLLALATMPVEGVE